MAQGDPTNAEIADRLTLFAALLELSDASPFSTRAYVRAAEIVRSTPTPVAELVRAGRIRELRGIGAGIEKKLRELVETGEIAELRALEEDVEPELVGFGRLLGLTPSRVLAIARDLGIRTAAEFRTAAQEGRLGSAKGVGPTTEAKIRAALERPPSASRGLTLDRSLALSRAVADALEGEVAGAPRRYCELSHELAVVCASDEAASVLERFGALPTIVTVLEREEDRALGVTVEGIPVTVVVAPECAFGTALFRATGSDEYVRAHEPLPEAPDEHALFAALGVTFRPPELRESPSATPPPGLVERDDIRGDLHCHTTWSDGRASVREMAEAALARGYEYLAICDHTPSVGVVHGLDAGELARQAEEIAEVNEHLAAEARSGPGGAGASALGRAPSSLSPFRVLRGVECDIRADGTLDADDAVLDTLEWVQLSLHAGQRRPRSELTRMVVEAMRHTAVRALSHPKGRLLNRRPENALDLEAVFEVARETGVAVEVNGLPDRLDLSAAHVREALSAGVDLVLNSDAHSALGLARLDLALGTARKGGATKGSVVNSRPLEQVLRR